MDVNLTGTELEGEEGSEVNSGASSKEEKWVGDLGG